MAYLLLYISLEYCFFVKRGIEMDPTKKNFSFSAQDDAFLNWARDAFVSESIHENSDNSDFNKDRKILTPIKNADGSVDHYEIDQAAFHESLRDNEFGGRTLTLNQKIELRRIFSGSKITFNTLGEITSGTASLERSNPILRQQQLKVIQKVEAFFEATHLNHIDGSSGFFGGLSDYFGEKLGDIGTDENALEDLFRSMTAEELALFEKYVELDFRSSGRNLDQILSDELSSKSLGRVLGIRDSLKRGQAHYEAKALAGVEAELKEIEHLKSFTPEDQQTRSQIIHERLVLRIIHQGKLGIEKNILEKQDIGTLLLLASSIETEKRLEQAQYYQEHSKLSGDLIAEGIEALREKSDSSHFNDAYWKFLVQRDELVSSIKTNSVSEELRKDYLTQAASVEKEFDILKAQEEEGQESLIQTLDAGAKTTTVIAGSSVAILGAVYFAPLAGVAGFTGLGGGFLVGGTGGTLLQTGLELERQSLSGDKKSFTDTLHQSATDSFGAAGCVLIGGGIQAGSGRILASNTLKTSTWGRGVQTLAANPYSQQLATNQGIGLFQAGLRADPTLYGPEDIILYSISGSIGSKLENITGHGKKHILAEALREGTEESAQSYFDPNNHAGLKSHDLLTNFAAGLSEIGPGVLNLSNHQHSTNIQSKDQTQSPTPKEVITTEPPAPPPPVPAEIQGEEIAKTGTSLDDDIVSDNSTYLLNCLRLHIYSPHNIEFYGQMIHILAELEKKGDRIFSVALDYVYPHLQNWPNNTKVLPDAVLPRLEPLLTKLLAGEEISQNDRFTSLLLQSSAQVNPQELVEIPGGSFVRGSAMPDLSFQDEGPPQLVEVSSFRMLRTPITNAHRIRYWLEYYATPFAMIGRDEAGIWRVVQRAKDEAELNTWLGAQPQGETVNGAGHDFARDSLTVQRVVPSADDPVIAAAFERLDHPSTSINWFEALSLADAMGGYLPTEAQWERAARGPIVNVTAQMRQEEVPLQDFANFVRGPFIEARNDQGYFGRYENFVPWTGEKAMKAGIRIFTNPQDAELQELLNYHQAIGAWRVFATENGSFADASIFSSVMAQRDSTRAVTEGVEGPFGLVDMSGNVWEWSNDFYGAYSVNSDGVIHNPVGLPNGNYRVLRGGSWFHSDIRHMCSALRCYFLPSSFYGDFGFRVAFNPVEPVKSKTSVVQDAKNPSAGSSHAFSFAPLAMMGGGLAEFFNTGSDWLSHISTSNWWQGVVEVFVQNPGLAGLLAVFPFLGIVFAKTSNTEKIFLSGLNIPEASLHPLSEEELKTPFPVNPLAEQALKHPEFTPRFATQVKGQEFLLSNPLNYDDHTLVIAYVKTTDQGNTQWQFRAFWYSKTGATWRAFYGFEKNGSFVKGNGEEKNYTRETFLEDDLQAVLNRLFEQNSHPIQSNQNIFDFFTNAQHEIELLKQEAFSQYFIERPKSLSSLHRYMPGRLSYRAEARRLFETDDNKLQDGLIIPPNWQPQHIDIRALTSLKYPEGFIPNFNENPIKVFDIKPNSKNKITVREFAGAKIEGKDIVWAMAEDSEGRTWVHEIYFPNTNINSFGVKRIILDAGILNSKPFDYTHQTDLIHPSLKKDSQTGHVKTSDISPALSWLEPIYLYRLARNLSPRFSYSPQTGEFPAIQR